MKRLIFWLLRIPTDNNKIEQNLKEYENNRTK